MKIFIAICRIIVGSLFIVSGLIKVNDVIGFSYKLEEYFSIKALGYPELLPYVIPIAMFIVLGEVLLGVATLLGAWPKITSSLLLFMTLFFAWLTYYTANCDPMQLKIFTALDGTYFIDTPECVLSCGCFGDAIKLTPMESFYKDIFLLPFVLPFFFAAFFNKVKLNTWKEDAYIIVSSLVLVALFGALKLDWNFPAVFVVVSTLAALIVKKFVGEKQWLMAIAVTIVCAFTQYWTYVHLPLKDYRPYAIGQDIVENMKSAEELGLEPPKFLTFYTLKNKSGETKEVDSERYLSENIWKDTTWKIVNDLTYTKKVSDGYEAKIQDFTALDSDGNELKDELVAHPGVFLLVMWNIEETEKDHLKEIAEFANKAQAAGKAFYGFTTASYDEYEPLRHEFSLAFPFLQGDEKVLKTMIRANPGLVYWENGKVVNMWAACDVPDYDKAAANGFKP
ncbi:MAG: DoxX family protein [Flavobacteriales bacterium]|jgi:uncharacterized membrane protein YphA (DoxX/SURF4 family)